MYRGSNLLDFALVACDRNSAPDGRSLVVFPAQAGINYWISISGVNGAMGVVRLNWCLGMPPLITQQPADQLASPGADVTLAVSASSTSALTYQWRLNGVNIRGATSSTLTLTNVARNNAGLYSVTVAGSCLTTDSRPARVLVAGPALSLADNFADRVIETAASSEGNGNNIGTTLEAGEPSHVGLSGGRSVWLGWTAPANGLATISTRGSGFDTLLAVYTNAVPGTVPAVGRLANVASDDDAGGFFTSKVSFPAVAGIEYLIAVDGFNQAEGDIFLARTFETAAPPRPEITLQPASQVVLFGGPASFVTAASGTSLSYQWLFNGTNLVDATNATLVLTNVQADRVGLYSVVVRDGGGNVTESLTANLEVSTSLGALSRDKIDTFVVAGESGLAFAVASAGAGFTSVSAGSIGTQLLTTTNSTHQLLENNHCGTIGGSSQWLTFRVLTNDFVSIDTLGSTFDTILAVYTGRDFLSLALVVCDNDGATDGLRSSVRFSARTNVDYRVVVDGYVGAQGIVQLNWRVGSGLSIPVRKVMPASSVTFTNPLAVPLAGATYQWLHNGREIPGATNATLALSNIQAEQAGVYNLRVGNATPSAKQLDVAVLSVDGPLSLAVTARRTNQMTEVRLRGTASQGFFVEGASNLMATNWGRLVEQPYPNQPLEFLDLGASNLPIRFYRSIPLP